MEVTVNVTVPYIPLTSTLRELPGLMLPPVPLCCAAFP
jgi:hypothetical protein